MKIKNVKRIISLFLVGTMIFSLGGCGKKKEKEENKEEKIEVIDNYDYQLEAEFDVIVENTVIKDNVMYASCFSWNEDVEGELNQGIITYNFNTKEKNQIELDIPEIYINKFYVNENKEIIVKGIRMVAAEEDFKFNEDIEYDEEDTIEEDILMERFSKYSEIELVYDENLECIVKNESELKETNGKEEILLNEMVMDVEYDDKGKAYLMHTTCDDEEGSKYYISIEDNEGGEIAKFDISGMSQGLMKMSDGSIVCSVWEDDGIKLYKIDEENNRLGEKIAELKESYNVGMYVGLNKSILINEGGYLKRLDYDDDKTKNILKYLDNGLFSEDVVTMYEYENDKFYIVMQDYEMNKTEIASLIKMDKDSVKVEKEEIHLATFFMEDSLEAQVRYFNKRNDRFKIVIDEYMSDDEDDFEQAVEKLNNDLISENCPDIINLTNFSVKEYVEKGVLESLGGYLKNDSEINETVFVQNILDAYKVNDEIYTIPIDFTIAGFIGMESVLGEEISWTMSEFVDFAEELPDDVSLMQDMTSDGFLCNILLYRMDEYVDWSKGECDFNSNEFIELLEYCSNFKNTEDFYDEYEEDENAESDIKLLRDKKLILKEFYCSSVYSFVEEKANFGEDIILKGYPAKNGNEIMIESYSPLLGICSNSKNKDVAWEFLKQFYTEDYQKDYNLHGFSIRQDKLDEEINVIKNMPVNKTDEGIEYIDEYMYDDVAVYIPPVTDEDIEKITYFIKSADTVAVYDDKIFNIVNDEAKEFFEGKKSVTETAESIQNSVSAYLKENN